LGVAGMPGNANRQHSRQHEKDAAAQHQAQSNGFRLNIVAAAIAEQANRRSATVRLRFASPRSLVRQSRHR
jgi:hypothetical protein